MYVGTSLPIDLANLPKPPFNYNSLKVPDPYISAEVVEDIRIPVWYRHTAIKFVASRLPSSSMQIKVDFFFNCVVTQCITSATNETMDFTPDMLDMLVNNETFNYITDRGFPPVPPLWNAPMYVHHSSPLSRLRFKKPLFNPYLHLTEHVYTDSKRYNSYALVLDYAVQIHLGTYIEPEIPGIAPHLHLGIS